MPQLVISIKMNSSSSSRMLNVYRHRWNSRAKFHYWALYTDEPRNGAYRVWDKPEWAIRSRIDKEEYLKLLNEIGHIEPIRTEFRVVMG